MTESLQRQSSSERAFPYQVFGQFRLCVCLAWSRLWFGAALSSPSSSEIWELIFILTKHAKNIWAQQINSAWNKSIMSLIVTMLHWEFITMKFTRNPLSPQSRGALGWAQCQWPLLAVAFVLTGWAAHALDSHCGNPESQRCMDNTQSERVPLVFKFITLCVFVHILSSEGNMVRKETRANILFALVLLLNYCLFVVYVHFCFLHKTSIHMRALFLTVIMEIYYALVPPAQ